MTNLDKCVYLFKQNGSQETEFKMAAYRATTDDNIQNASIIRAICMKHANNWDGKSTSKFYQKVKQIVLRAKKSISSESFNIEKFESMSSIEKQKILKRKQSTTREERGRKKSPITKQQEEMEKALFAYITQLWKEKKRVTRTIILKKVLQLYPLFKGGRKTNPNWMREAKGWFYHGFKKRYNLSYTRVAGASRKLPPNWKLLLESINRRVAKSQTPRKEDHLVIPAVPDGRVCNSDHIPFYRDMAGAYSWTQKGAGGGEKKDLRGQLGTGGGEKDRFTVQISCCKDGTKLPPFIIFKAKPPDGRREFASNTVAYELKNRVPDNAGNSYPPADKVYLTCNDTANSNSKLTIEILENIIFKELGVFDGNRIATLVDDFKGHSKQDVKEYVNSFKSGNNNTHAEDRFNLVDFLIMAGGITPKGQPVDIMIGKILKGYFWDYYDDYMLTCPVNDKGHPITPSRQLCATWVVNAWEKVRPELIRKAWQLANYKSVDEIERENCGSEIVIFNQDHIVREIALIDEEAVDHYLAEDNILNDELEEDT